MTHVTIAIPTHGRGPLLRRAIDSALKQTYQGHLEILVVENPSDSSPHNEATFAESVCLEFEDARIRYIRNSTNLGMAGNWNNCIQLAESPWLIILHDDDWLAPIHVEAAFSLVESNPEIKLIGCHGYIERIDSPYHPDKHPDHMIPSIQLLPYHFLLGNPMFASGVLLNRESAMSLGGFDPAWYPTMDHMLWLRFSESFSCAKIQYPLMHYFIGSNASLAPKTLISTITNDYKQRNDLISRCFSNNFILLFYSRIKPYRERIFLENRFNIKIPIDHLKTSLLSVGWRPTPFIFRLIYFPIRFFMEIFSILTTRHLHPIHISQKIH